MLPWCAGSKGGGDMQDELSIEKARVAILVEERNELLRKVFELEEQVRRLTQRARDGARFCPACHALLEEGSVYCDTCGTDTPRP